MASYMHPLLAKTEAVLQQNNRPSLLRHVDASIFLYQISDVASLYRQSKRMALNYLEVEDVSTGKTREIPCYNWVSNNAKKYLDSHIAKHIFAFDVIEKHDIIQHLMLAVSFETETFLLFNADTIREVSYDDMLAFKSEITTSLKNVRPHYGRAELFLLTM